MDPGSGVGIVGHLAAICRPKATVEANEAESCFLRPLMRTGAAVSAPDGGAAAEGTATGTGDARPVESTTVRPAAESGLVVPLGVTAGVASRAAPQAVAKKTSDSAARRTGWQFIRTSCCNVHTVRCRDSRYEAIARWRGQVDLADPHECGEERDGDRDPGIQSCVLAVCGLRCVGVDGIDFHARELSRSGSTRNAEPSQLQTRDTGASPVLAALVFLNGLARR